MPCGVLRSGTNTSGLLHRGGRENCWQSLRHPKCKCPTAAAHLMSAKSVLAAGLEACCPQQDESADEPPVPAREHPRRFGPRLVSLRRKRINLQRPAALALGQSGRFVAPASRYTSFRRIRE